jgi:hypothetical protein
VEKKKQLLDLLKKSYENELRFIAGFKEEELASSGTVQDWAIKDEIAHIAAWKAISSERLRAFMAEEEPRNYDDVDAANDEIFNRDKEKSWQEVAEFHKRAYLELVEDVRKIGEEDILDGQRYEWLKGRSLWRRTVHNGYFHPQGHIAFYFSHHGDKERGNQLMEKITATLISLDEQPLWHGRAVYNLACYYSLFGEKETAVKKLQAAFALSPDMIEWSQSDSDLDNIRDMPDYLALIGESIEKE